MLNFMVGWYPIQEKNEMQEKCDFSKGMVCPFPNGGV
jgi:hypothetical protein